MSNLKQLNDDGILSDSEYTEQKEKVITDFDAWCSYV